VARVAVKPIPSIAREQQTVNLANEPVTIKIGGRHDISAIPRIVPVCEAMVALTLADHLLRQRAIQGFGGGGRPAVGQQGVVWWTGWTEEWTTWTMWISGELMGYATSRKIPRCP
jgi:hypothetical protein